MIEIGRAEAVAFMRDHHYIGTVPAPCTTFFGRKHYGKLVAVACYGHCHVPKFADTFMELRRLAAGPAMPVPLSSFLAATMREMGRRGARALVTWADPGAGHHGGIYQATNWVYCEPRSYNWNASFRTPDGKVFTHREVFKVYGTSSKNRMKEIHPDWEPFLPPMKLRYIYPISLSKEACLEHMRARECPYPKPAYDTPRATKRIPLKMRTWA
ncbi:MAG: hypothetical protein AAAC47_01990 [Pararhizobium sp.]